MNILKYLGNVLVILTIKNSGAKMLKQHITPYTSCPENFNLWSYFGHQDTPYQFYLLIVFSETPSSFMKTKTVRSQLFYAVAYPALSVGGGGVK